jgi:hypothetical protein
MAAGLLSDGDADALQRAGPRGYRHHARICCIQHGIDISMEHGNGAPEGRTMHAESGAAEITSTAPYDIVRKMRASVLVLGPAGGAFGDAEVSLPGGCAIGTRPVDLHVMGAGAMGAEIELEGRLYQAPGAEGPEGRDDPLPPGLGRGHREPADGRGAGRGHDDLENAAREPEIADLAQCLMRDGREDRRHRQGRPCASWASPAARRRLRRHAGPHRAGTYAMAAAPSPAATCCCSARGWSTWRRGRTLRNAGMDDRSRPPGCASAAEERAARRRRA